MFVVKKIAGTVKHDIIGFNNEDQAISFCEKNDWRLLDENCFEWDLEIEEEPGEAEEIWISPEPCHENDCDDPEWQHNWGTEDYDPYDPFEE